MNGQIFEEASAPEEPHPNCKCTLIPVDANGNKTGDPKTPRKPKPKGNCTKIQSHYGMRKYPRTGRETFHHGPDISAPNGTPIKSIDDGKVILSGAQNPNNLAEGFGYRVTLETKYGTAVYGHMNGTPAVKEEDVVSAGDLLGNVGKSGGSTGNHLHYERRDKNNNSFPPSKEDLQKLLDSLNRECK